MRGRLRHEFIAKIARLDTIATLADPDAGGPLTSGYDPDFKETVVFQIANERRNARAESEAIDVRCNIEVDAWDVLQQRAGGDDPNNNVRIIVHISEIERLDLVTPGTGEIKIRKNDRLVSIHDGCGTLVQKLTTALFVTEVRPLFGIGRGRDLFMITFQDRDSGAAG